MAQPDAHFVGQRVVALDRRVQLLDAAARKVAARGADVRREQGVADPDVAIDAVAEAVGGMARRGHDLDAQRAGLDHVALGQQQLERAGQGWIVAGQREDVGEVRLHRADPRADRDRRGRARAQERGRREVVGVRVGLEDAVHVQAVLGNVAEQQARAVGGDGGGAGVVIEHRIDHHRVAAAADDVTPGVGGVVEERLDGQLGGERFVGHHGVGPHCVEHRAYSQSGWSAAQ